MHKLIADREPHIECADFGTREREAHMGRWVDGAAAKAAEGISIEMNCVAGRRGIGTEES
jgi:nicotinic acid phosphoribosyltransferase